MSYTFKPWPVDVLAVKEFIKNGRLQVTFHGNNILLKDTSSGEAVKIGELPREDEK